MEQETIKSKKCCVWGKENKGNASTGAVYSLGVIGAAIYFIQHAGTFWAGALGILKALVWPAFAVYKIFEYFKF